MKLFRRCFKQDKEQINKHRDSLLSHIICTTLIAAICCALSLTIDCLSFIQELNVRVYIDIIILY